MSLITDIATILEEQYPDATRILSSKFNANVTAYLTDISRLPLIITDNELVREGSIQKNNNVLKDSKVLISFLDLDSVNNTDEESEAIRARMETMADQIAAKIYQLEAARVSGGNNQKYKTTPMFHVFSTNMTGVALEMQVNYNTIVTF